MHVPKSIHSEEWEQSVSQFWSGDLGLTLMTISVCILIFIITPLREAALPGRFVFDTIVLILMVFGAISVDQGKFSKFVMLLILAVTALVIVWGRVRPSLTLHIYGSALTTLTLLAYVRIVLLIMFRKGTITWSRIQGGICAYLLLGMAWASSYQLVEQSIPGSFHFVSAPADMDQMSSKLTYYSFCTLTTVGGEITPHHPFARSLTIAEAVMGQLFPVVLISTLVAMAMQSHRKP